MPPDLFKKKIDEYFASDPDGKIIALTDALKVNNAKKNSVVNNSGKNTAWKEQTVMIAVSFDHNIRFLNNFFFPS